MIVPPWISRRGLLLHVAVGLLLLIILQHFHSPPIATVIAAVALGTAKEQAEENWSDFRRVNGGPWNGLVDILAFALGPLIWLGVSSL